MSLWIIPSWLGKLHQGLTKTCSWISQKSKQLRYATWELCLLQIPLDDGESTARSRWCLAYEPWTLPQRGSWARSRTGEKQPCIPIDLASVPMARPTRYTMSVSNEAAIAIFCGNSDCLNDPTPWRHSSTSIMGILMCDLSNWSFWTVLKNDLFMGYLVQCKIWQPRFDGSVQTNHASRRWEMSDLDASFALWFISRALRWKPVWKLPYSSLWESFPTMSSPNMRCSCKTTISLLYAMPWSFFHHLRLTQIAHRHLWYQRVNELIFNRWFICRSIIASLG